MDREKSQIVPNGDGLDPSKANFESTARTILDEALRIYSNPLPSDIEDVLESLTDYKPDLPVDPKDYPL